MGGIESNCLEFHLRVTAAMQLISTSESPGSAATATVVRMGRHEGEVGREHFVHPIPVLNLYGNTFA